MSSFRCCPPPLFRAWKEFISDHWDHEHFRGGRRPSRGGGWRPERHRKDSKPCGGERREEIWKWTMGRSQGRGIRARTRTDYSTWRSPIRPFGPPSPEGRGKDLWVFLLPPGEGGPKGRVRDLQVE